MIRHSRQQTISEHRERIQQALSTLKKKAYRIDSMEVFAYHNGLAFELDVSGTLPGPYELSINASINDSLLFSDTLRRVCRMSTEEGTYFVDLAGLAASYRRWLGKAGRVNSFEQPFGAEESVTFTLCLAALDDKKEMVLSQQELNKAAHCASTTGKIYFFCDKHGCQVRESQRVTGKYFVEK